MMRLYEVLQSLAIEQRPNQIKQPAGRITQQAPVIDSTKVDIISNIVLISYTQPYQHAKLGSQ
jgi:hypothetical protein